MKRKNPEIIVIAHNIRSIFNVGSIFRTCEGFGVKQLILTGYTPYPKIENDERLPHIAQKLTEQIHKTALDAEKLVPFTHEGNPDFDRLKQLGYTIVGLEQDKNSIMLPEYKPPQKIALLLGEEIYGITDDMRQKCDDLIEIPMFGKKESFNVSVATGVALYGLISSI